MAAGLNPCGSDEPNRIRRNRIRSEQWAQPGSWVREGTAGRNAGPSVLTCLLVLSGSALSLYLSEFRWPHTPIVVASDQWINIHGALRMAHGERIYADFFQYTWPGTEALYAGLIHLCGAPAALFCIAAILVGLAFVALGIRLAERVELGTAAVLPGLLYLAFARVGFDTTHHKFSILLVLAATAVLLSGQELGRLAAAGAIIGLAAFFTQTRAICLLAIAAFMLFRAYESKTAWRRIAAQQGVLLLSFAIVVVGLLWKFVEPIGLGRFVQLTLSFPLHYYRAGDHNNWGFYLSVPPLASGVFFYWLVINTLVPAIYLLFFLIWWRGRRRDPSQPWDNLMLINLIGLSLFFSIGYAPILSRLCEVSLPAMVLAVWLVRSSAYEGVATVCMWSAACMGLIVLAVRTQTRTNLTVPTPSGNVAVVIPNNSAKSMAASAWLAAHTQPGDSVFVADDPTLYTLLGLTNPTELPFITATAYTRPEQIVKALADLASRKPRYILWGDNLDPSRDAQGDALPPLRSFLRERFAVVKEFPNGERIFAPDTPEQTNSNTMSLAGGPAH